MKFLIFGSQADYGRLRMNDIVYEPNVLTITPGDYRNRIIRILFKIHYSKRLEKYIKLPFRDLWIPSIINCNDISNFDCIVFEEYNILYQNNKFLSYLMRQNPKAKMVFLFSNPIKQKKKEWLKKLKDNFDLLITFDRLDAENYGLTYYCMYYSEIPIPICEEPPIDIFFIGKNKGRLKNILKAYHTMRANGLSCEFYITDVAKDELTNLEGIVYNRKISYMEVLKKVQRARCILEILQEGQEGATLRTMEAITYGKKLLTNNRSITDEPYYDERYMSVFNNPGDIDIDFIKKPIENITYPYKQNLSPRILLKFIEKEFGDIHCKEKLYCVE